MSSVYPWIYVDYTNNIWKFFRNDNEELRYKIMYGEGKWTKESLIDKEVLGFSVYVEEDETIHIVYSNIKRELKYCTLKDKQWVGKTLYQMESNEFEIQNLKVEIIGYEMHIFYLLVSNDGSDHGVLMHCIWNGKEIRVNELQDIILIPNLKEHYSVNVNEKKNIDVFFITDEGDEKSLNYCNFQNHRWSSVKRLYGIQGEDIGFQVLRNQKYIHILNKSREDSIYLLDHVCIDTSGNIQEFKVHESNKELTEPILFIESNNLYSCWLEEDEIFYSIFDSEKWGSKLYFDRGNKVAMIRYNCFICCDGESSLKEVGVYGTNELDLCLLVPSQFVVNMKDSFKYEVNQANAATLHEEESLQSLKLELSRVKSEKKNLEEKIVSLNMQLQKKQKFMEEYEDRIARILEQKRKADENYNVFLELQQNIQKELEDANQQLANERKIKLSIENKLKECKEENVIIRQQIKMISEEKNKLCEELEFEKNQSIMERLLRKRPSGI
ncbi:hypothetical protein [Clostridium saccharoperbutylacetonicum]|uniref:hypothetical protein n=1 Tax=Clostridium saccharoperbutylacetonicum TaxID=36745 RepID=UPI00156FCB8A|nr:hypothetical protein [Clostridium saccharoperbutylacetonicum]NSB30304.1 hypothetical protein [Clostridium saccharoperbutylacetonicum]